MKGKTQIPVNDLKLKVILVNKEKKEGKRGTNLYYYEEEFHYANKDNFVFYHTFKTNQTFKEVKKIIQEKTKFFPDMMSFGIWTHYDEKENTSYYKGISYKDEDTLYNSCYNQTYTEARYLYIIIDKNKNENYKALNNFAEEMNKKIKETNEKNESLEISNKSLMLELDFVKSNMAEKEKNYNNRIETMENSHNKEIEELNNKLFQAEENFKKSNKEFEEYSNIEKEKNKIAQEALMKKIKNIEDKQKMEKEKEIKIEREAESIFNKQIIEIKNNFYSDFEKKLAIEIKKFCLFPSKKKTDSKVDLVSNRLVKLLHNNYDALSLKIFENTKANLSLKTEEIYKNQIILFTEEQFNGHNHINTIAIGNAGVGKSTLINNILKIKGTKFEAKAGYGKSVTKNVKMYTSEKVPFLRVYDTPGLDFKLDIKTLFQNIKSIVENNLNSNDPDKFINCIWYCITGTRFQEEDKSFIKEIMNLYSSSYLPLIIVFLQMGEDAANKSKNAIIELFKETKEDHLLDKTKFCRVVSEDIKEGKVLVAKADGFPKLLELTKNEIKNSVESALYENIQKRIRNKSFEFTGIINKSIEEIFEDDISYLSCQKNFLDKISEDKNEEEIINEEEEIEEKANENEIEYDKNDYYKNFTFLVSGKLEEINQILKNNYSLKKESTLIKRNIQEILLKIRQLILNWENFNKFYEKIVIKESEILSRKIIEKQNEIDFQQKSKISQRGYQWTKICKEEIYQKYKEFALKELFKLSFAIFSQRCLLNIKKNVKDLFDEIINKKDICNLILSKAKKCMNYLIDDIKYESKEEKDKKEEKENNGGKNGFKIKKEKGEEKKEEEEQMEEQEEEEEEKSQDVVGEI